jgi:hypothetical protein
VRYCKDRPGREISRKQIVAFIGNLSESCRKWQVQQAKDAIRLYFYFRGNARSVPVKPNSGTDSAWPSSIDQMIKALRLKHLSYRTEQTCINWMRRYYRYVKSRVPTDLDARHVTDFLTYLAVDRKVSASTQKQAFNAILFFLPSRASRGGSEI